MKLLAYNKEEKEFVNIDPEQIASFKKDAVRVYNKSGTFKKWGFILTLTLEDKSQIRVSIYNLPDLKKTFKGKVTSTHYTEEEGKRTRRGYAQKRGTSWTWKVKGKNI
jgi:hypothetical protein